MTFPFVGTHTAADWNGWNGVNHAVEEDTVTIATADRKQYVEPTWLIAEPPLRFEVVDLDVDGCGDIWLLTADGIYRYDPDRADLRRLHCTWDRAPATPRAIAVTDDTVYVAIGADGGASDGDGGRVHAFSKHLAQTRWIAEIPYADPVALARHGETVSVLDRGAGDGEPFVAEVGPGGVPESRVAGLGSPVDLAVDVNGDRYVLDHPGDSHVVSRIPVGETTVETAVPPGEFVTGDTGTRLAPDTLAAGVPGEIIVGTPPSADTPIEPSLFRHDPPTEGFERLTTYTGSVEELLARRGEAAREAGLYVVGAVPDEDGNALAFLPAVERTRLNPDTGRYDGQVVRRLDAGERGTQWHRLTASLETPTGTQVRIYYHATDDDPVVRLQRVRGIGPIIADRLRSAGIRELAELVQSTPGRLAAAAGTDSYPVSTDRAADWIDDAEDVLDRAGRAAAPDWRSVGPPDPEDALVDDAEGRYLWVKVELIGTPAAAPRVDSLRAYFPRQSYLRYLPAIFRDDPQAAEFLERYLSLFESVFTDIEEEISAATRYLDPEGIPGESLSWLAGWLALSPDETWSTAAKRELVARAHELFEERGTRQGLRELLSIYLADRATRPPAWQWAIDRQRAVLDFAAATDIGPDDIDGLVHVDVGVGDSDTPGVDAALALAHAENLFDVLGTNPDRAAIEDGAVEGTFGLFIAADDPARVEAELVAIGEVEAATVTEVTANLVAGAPDGPPASPEGTRTRLDRTLFVREQSDLDCVDGTAHPEVRTTYERLLPCPQCFAVLLWPSLSDDTVREAERLVETTRPAHTVGRTIQLQPQIQLAGHERDRAHHTYLGVNSVLADREFALETSVLGTDTRLSEHEASGQFGTNHRLGVDTDLSL
jgi:phage tail-like protein